MSMQISPSARLRPSPFFSSIQREGCVSCTTYNNMILPLGFGDPEGEYWRLIRSVSMWDVAAERQVQLHGRDAARLAAILCPRDLTKCVAGQGKYVAVCDHKGILLNDPILLKVEEDKFWLSIADSNIWYWASAIAAERGLEVEVSEPDVSPLAVQGPKAQEVVASIFGDWVRDLRYFWFKEAKVGDIPVMVARSGWSKQGGYEIYLLDGTRGNELWNIVREAGAPWDIAAGAPNWIERIESGLLSFGGDTDAQTNPFEVRLGKYVDLDVDDDVIGIGALRTIAQQGAARHQVGIKWHGGAPAQPEHYWREVLADGKPVGHLTNCAFSPRLECNIGFGLVDAKVKVGDTVSVRRDEGLVTASVVDMPFIR